MTATIKESLSALNLYIDDLEQIAVQAQDNTQKKITHAAEIATKLATEEALKNAKTAKKSPPDLFSVPAGDDVDAKALASRLDGAIAKVEKLLKEGA